MSRRDQIRMTPEEVDAFLNGRHVMNVATIGADGRPHLVAMWYGFVAVTGAVGTDRAPAFWTYPKSQKVVNLRRDPRITCLVEDGDEYAELRGAELVGTATILEDPADVLAVGRSVAERYTGPVTDEVLPFLEAQATKRVGVRIDVEKTVSWDHRKLGGGY